MIKKAKKKTFLGFIQFEGRVHGVQRHVSYIYIYIYIHIYIYLGAAKKSVFEGNVAC